MASPLFGAAFLTVAETLSLSIIADEVVIELDNITIFEEVTAEDKAVSLELEVAIGEFKAIELE